MMRQHMQHIKWFSRLAAAHYRIENHVHMVALYTTWYSSTWINSSIHMSLAIAAGLTEGPWDIGDMIELIEGCQTSVQRASCGDYSW